MPTIINIKNLNISQLNHGDNQKHSTAFKPPEYRMRDCSKCHTICNKYAEHTRSLRDEIIKLKEQLFTLEVECYQLKRDSK